MTDDDSPDWGDYESGPFCRHWMEAGDCEEVCATCGHRCLDHGANDGDFSCAICDCAAWTEAADE